MFPCPIIGWSSIQTISLFSLDLKRTNLMTWKLLLITEFFSDKNATCLPVLNILSSKATWWLTMVALCYHFSANLMLIWYAGSPGELMLWSAACGSLSEMPLWMTDVVHAGSPSLFEPPHDKTNKISCVPSEDSDQPEHPPSLIRVFTVRFMGS